MVAGLQNGEDVSFSYNEDVNFSAWYTKMKRLLYPRPYKQQFYDYLITPIYQSTLKVNRCIISSIIPSTGRTSL